MDCSNSDMMEAEFPSITAGERDSVRHLLTLARQFINQRKPSQALQAVVMAMRTQECAIAEAQQPLNPEPTESNNNMSSSSVVDGHANSILAETGRMQVVMDAFSDGSSFICLQCGGLVSNHRKDEHYAYWCAQI
ncbi:hypothetical protein Csa_012402 [Cucumis sativus]|nr:hypothetical protein Csa_012402 [Cucumis sativus]